MSVANSALSVLHAKKDVCPQHQQHTLANCYPPLSILYPLDLLASVSLAAFNLDADFHLEPKHALPNITTKMKPSILWVGALAIVAIALPLDAARYENLAQVREARKDALQKQRRVIFNNDGNEPVYTLKDLSKEALLSERTTPLAGSQVDSLFYCTWSSGFGLFTHATKLGHLFTTKEAMFASNRTLEMIEAGVDPLKVMAEFTKEHHMELFWSFRMNDTHDGSKTDYAPIMLRANPLKMEHPEWLIGSETEKPKYGAWTAVDYTRDEIRDLAFTYTEEVCRNYDISGIELDFFRHPVFFKRAAMTGTPCNTEESSLMTQLIRRIRTMTEEVAQLRGSPILLAVRIPDSTEYAKACGLDIEAWLAEGLVDMLMMGGYFQLNPWENSATLAHKYGVKAYASLDESRIRDEKSRALRMSVAAYRGRSAAALAAGMDGVYLFNSFNPRSPIWRELGSKEQLASLDKDYFASVRGLGAAAGGALQHSPFVKVPTLNPASPILIPPGGSAKTTFTAGQESGQDSIVSIFIQTAYSKEAPAVSATLNGNPLERRVTLDDDWTEFTAKKGWLRAGTNEVEITTQNVGGKPIRWQDLRCTVRYISKASP